jgi:hypothetical protein
MLLAQGDMLRTSPASAAEIKFLDGFVIQVRPESLVNIETPEGHGAAAALGVDAGAVSAEATQAGTRPEIKTGVANWAGTQAAGEPPAVDVDIRSSKDSTFTQRRGEGEVKPLKGGPRTLAPRTRLSVSPDGTPGPTLSLPAAPALLSPQQGTALTYPEPQSSATRLSWSPVPGAVSYRLMLDHGAFFLAPIVDQAGIKTTSWELRALPEGKYYWKVAAVGQHDAETFSAFFRFSISRTPGAPPPITVDLFEIKGNVLHITGRTTPGSTVTVNGQQIDVGADGAFSEYVTLPRPGPQTVTLRATDSRGRVTELTRNLTSS